MPHGPPPPLGESLKEPVWSRHESVVRATLLSPAAAHAPLGKSYYLLGEELLQLISIRSSYAGAMMLHHLSHGAEHSTIAAVARVLRINFKGVAITPATSKVVAGEGMPRRGGGRGDLVITFDVRFPAAPVADPAKQAALRGALA